MAKSDNVPRVPADKVDKKRPTSDRLPAIDVIRGFCIVSMVSGHIASGSVFARGMHVVPAFDGASGFVLLSGLVLGMVQSKRFSSQGLAAVQRKTAHRIWVIISAQLALIILAIVLGFAALHEHRNMVQLDAMSTSDVVMGILTLHLAPPSGSVLRLYVVLMGLALAAYWLLAIGQWVLLLVGSALIYAVGYFAPQLTSFRSYHSDALGANWAAWQALFLVAMVFGWKWKTWGIPNWLRAHPVMIASITGALIAIAFIGERILPNFYIKTMMAPGLLLNAYAVVLFSFVILTWLLGRTPKWVSRPFEMIGTRSLDSYIIQAGVTIIIPSIYLFQPDSLTSTVLAVSTLLCCWAWAEFRRSKYWSLLVLRRARSMGGSK